MLVVAFRGNGTDVGDPAGHKSKPIGGGDVRSDSER